MKTLFLTLLLLVWAFAAKAQFTYTTNAGTIVISGYTGSGGAVIVPSTVFGMQVVGIANNAFLNNTLVTSVTLPSSVTAIGDTAFQGCSSMSGVIIPQGVQLIGQNAFNGCSQLGSVTVPSSVASLGQSAFSGCSKILSASIGNGLNAIPQYAFQNCGLTSVTIPSSVTSIGSAAFQGCSGLTSVIFQGNAPTPNSDSSVFSGDTLATASYPAGKTGWTATFDGISTAMQGVAPTPPALGISTYSGDLPTVFFPTATGTNFVLQMTTNLTSPNWVTVTNGVPFSGVEITNPPSNAFFRLQ